MNSLIHPLFYSNKKGKKAKIIDQSKTIDKKIY